VAGSHHGVQVAASSNLAAPTKIHGRQPQLAFCFESDMAEDPDRTMQMPAGAAAAKPAGRSIISEADLLKVLTAHMQANEQCRQVRVVSVTRWDAPDSGGCNWSPSVVLDPAGVPPEVYAVVYAEAVKRARERYNLA
jgi:hypothetical protein